MDIMWNEIKKCGWNISTRVYNVDVITTRRENAPKAYQRKSLTNLLQERNISATTHKAISVISPQRKATMPKYYSIDFFSFTVRHDWLLAKTYYHIGYLSFRLARYCLGTSRYIMISSTVTWAQTKQGELYFPSFGFFYGNFI